MKQLLTLVFILFVTTGCVEDKPKPESNVEIVPIKVADLKRESIEVAVHQQPNLELAIKHHIHNQDVYVECYIPHFIFKEKGGDKRNGEGHIEIFVDNKKMSEMNTAAFIIKGLEKGGHEMRLEVIHNDSSSYELNKTIEFTIE